MSDTRPPIAMKELRERWGLTANALKARANALGIDLLRPTGNSTYWPGDKIELGEQLHQWLKDGHAMSLFPAVRENTNQSALTRQSSVSHPAETALVPIRQRMTDLRQEDPLALARRLVEAADLQVPLTNQEMAEVLGVSSIGKDKDGSSPRPGFTLHRSEHNGNPFWSVVRVGGAPPITATSAPSQLGPKRVGFNTAAHMTIDIQAVDCSGSDLFDRMRL